MYQEWKTPPFGLEKLVEFCAEFFKSRQVSTSVQRNGQKVAIISANVMGLRGTLSLVVEHVGSTLKLTFPPPSRVRGDLNRFLGTFVTGLGIKADAERQLVLDGIEQDFWEYLDRRLADLVSESQSDLD